MAVLSAAVGTTVLMISHQDSKKKHIGAYWKMDQLFCDTIEDSVSLYDALSRHLWLSLAHRYRWVKALYFLFGDFHGFYT